MQILPQPGLVIQIKRVPVMSIFGLLRMPVTLTPNRGQSQNPLPN
jgi:hypothetical protein